MYQAVCDTSELNLVIDFVKRDFFNCPYLYCNLKKYGIGEGRTRLFICKDETDIQAVALIYHDCLHLYFSSFEVIDKELFDFIEEHNPHTIFMSSQLKDNRMIELDGYAGKEVLVMSPKKYLDIDISLAKTASASDIPRVAEFMNKNWPEIYYSSQEACEQMLERLKDNYGRTKFIEIDGEIVACNSSFAEVDDFAVCSGLLVSKTQRGKNFGSIMVKSLYEELAKEGKSACGIILEDYSRVFHTKNGFEVVGKIVKYVKC